jgi:hypothetical protein
MIVLFNPRPLYELRIHLELNCVIIPRPLLETYFLAKQLLFYEKVTPISKAAHADFCMDGGVEGYEFAREVNSVILAAVEIPAAAREYAIVFAGNDEAVVPVVILGIKDNENLYLDEKGAWNANYVPAFVRRYPFVFSQSEDAKTFTLCVDEQSAAFNKEGRGERLFDDEGEKTPYLDNVLKFLEDYQAQIARTQAYCKKLKDLDLLESMKADLTLDDGTKHSLTGFMAVSREKLKKLSPEKLAELVKTDELELTYDHLQSMSHLLQMPKRTSERAAAKDKK